MTKIKLLKTALNRVLIICLLSALGVYSYGATFQVTNLNDSGPGSFRQAIMDANDNPGPDIIEIITTGIIELTSEAFEDIVQLDPVSDCVIQGNGATLSGLGDGRILQLNGNVELHDLTFTGGNALLTGGALSISGIARIERCLFINNSAPANGGGALRVNTGSILTLINSTFTQNSSGFGGAINIRSGAVVNMTNCTLSGNTVTGGGGAVYIWSGGELNMTNSILANSLPEGIDDLLIEPDPPARGKTTRDVNINTNNLVENCAGDCPVFDLMEDPLLAPLGDYGESTMTFAFLPGSPVLGQNIGAYPALVGIPTLGEWGMIILGLLLTIFGTVLIRLPFQKLHINQ